MNDEPSTTDIPSPDTPTPGLSTPGASLSRSRSWLAATGLAIAAATISIVGINVIAGRAESLGGTSRGGFGGPPGIGNSTGQFPGGAPLGGGPP